MSAMHWEARRRQSALERRLAHKQQLLAEDSPPSAPSPSSSDVPEPAPSPERTAVEQCPHCKSTLGTPHSAAKISNRYSSLQYKQQW